MASKPLPPSGCSIGQLGPKADYQAEFTRIVGEEVSDYVAWALGPLT